MQKRYKKLKMRKSPSEDSPMLPITRLNRETATVFVRKIYKILILGARDLCGCVVQCRITSAVVGVVAFADGDGGRSEEIERAAWFEFVKSQPPGIFVSSARHGAYCDFSVSHERRRKRVSPSL